MEPSQGDFITYDDPVGREERARILAQLKAASPSQDVEREFEPIPPADSRCDADKENEVSHYVDLFFCESTRTVFPEPHSYTNFSQQENWCIMAELQTLNCCYSQKVGWIWLKFRKPSYKVWSTISPIFSNLDYF